MRRMYSEQELTRIIGEVFDQKLESGALDSSISDAVDAYLVEHPVDITALEGQTIAPAVVNAATSISAPAISSSGDITATGDISADDIAASGNITGNSIIENMSGYSLSEYDFTHMSNAYVGVVKNGNKITFALSFDFEIATQGEYQRERIARFVVPLAIYNALVASNFAGLYDVVTIGEITAFTGVTAKIKESFYIQKSVIDGAYVLSFILMTDQMSLETSYKIRLEQTFLLGENLVTD